MKQSGLTFRRVFDWIGRLILVCAIAFWAAGASAHQLGWSYVFLNVTPEGVDGKVQLPVSQLHLLGLETTGEHEELNDLNHPGWDVVQAYASRIVGFQVDGEPIEITFHRRDRMFSEIANYVDVYFQLDVETPTLEKIEVRFEPFFEFDPNHRGGLLIVDNSLTGVMDNHTEIALVFAPNRISSELNVFGDSAWMKGWRFVEEGAWHIWIGIDHVLFLVTLLFTAVMQNNSGSWRGVPDFRRAMINLISVVTLFTVAHSITLALAIKGWVGLPSRLVESIIALSVVVVAANNIRPFLHGRIWPLVFLFGLFHGLGFPSVLVDLLITRESKIIALLGFNIGVELGQLVIVILVFPLLFMIRNRQWYANMVLPVCSGMVALIGLWWLVTRVFGLESPIASF